MTMIICLYILYSQNLHNKTELLWVTLRLKTDYSNVHKIHKSGEHKPENCIVSTIKLFKSTLRIR